MGKACLKCLRVIVILFNFLFVVIGLALVALAIYCYVDPTSRALRKASPSIQLPIEIALYVMMAVGVIVVFVGTFGCCGAYHESECLLGTYFVCVLIIFVAEVTAVVLGIYFKKSLFETTDETMESIAANYHSDKRSKSFMDIIHKAFRCCGWSRGTSTYVTETSVSLPPSCCNTTTTCDIKTMVAFKSQKPFIFEDNCRTVLLGMLNRNYIWIMVGAGAIAFTQFLAMILACSFCCCVNRQYTDSGYIGVHT